MRSPSVSPGLLTNNSPSPRWPRGGCLVAILEAPSDLLDVGLLAKDSEFCPTRETHVGDPAAPDPLLASRAADCEGGDAKLLVPSGVCPRILSVVNIDNRRFQK
jgi:hypothetical protein